MKQKETLLNIQVSKMKRKNLFITFLTIVAIITILIVFFYPSKDKNKNVETREKYKIEAQVLFHSNKTGEQLSRLWVELADTPYEQSKGLMYKNYMPDSVGMLFIYPGSEERSYWMQNTRISLDIIYVNEELEIVSAYEFTIPYSEDGLPSHEICKYVVETNAGYMQEHGIKVGDKIQIKN